MIFIVRLISRTFGQNVSKIALFEHSLKEFFAETTPYAISLKKLFCQNVSKPVFFTRKVHFSKCLSKNFVIFDLTSINYVY